ncbi:MAG: hypothetical protein V4577_22115 [Bacteroidota bacterium]
MSKATPIKSKLKNALGAVMRSFQALKRPSKQTNQKLMLQRGETPDDIIIKDVTIDEIPELSRLHAQTQEAYPLSIICLISQYQLLFFFSVPPVRSLHLFG